MLIEINVWKTFLYIFFHSSERGLLYATQIAGTHLFTLRFSRANNREILDIT